MPRVAIIGSGVAGLAAASTLQEHGVDFTLFEAEAHVGGHAHTVLVRPLRDPDHRTKLGKRTYVSKSNPKRVT